MTIPTLDDLQPARRGLPSGIGRDLLAVALILFGAAGLVAVAFIVDPLLGAAVLSVAALVIGLALGLGR